MFIENSKAASIQNLSLYSTCPFDRKSASGKAKRTSYNYIQKLSCGPKAFVLYSVIRSLSVK